MEDILYLHDVTVICVHVNKNKRTVTINAAT